MRLRVTAAIASAFVVLVLAVAAIGPAAAASSDPCSGGATPTVSFVNAASTLDVPAGAGSAIPPPVQVDCGATAAPANTSVSVVLTAQSGDVDFASGLASQPQAFVVYPSATTLTAETDANGQITLPIVTALSNSAGGGFVISVTAGSASASLSGQITGTTAGILPPSNPSANETDAGVDCAALTSAQCITDSVAQINEGRQAEDLGPLELPSNWGDLSVPEQLYVLVNLERTARGLVPVTGLADDWDSAAQQGANAGEDPDSPGSWSSAYDATVLNGSGVETYASNDYLTGADWAGGFANAIQAMSGWVYDDGPGSANGDCTSSDSSGCWGHRDSIIQSASAAADPGTATSACALQCVMGAAYAATDSDNFGPSYTLIFGPGSNADPVSFAWASEVSDLPACEQSEDSCAWAGQPIETSGGTFTTVGSTTTTPTTSTSTSTAPTSTTSTSSTPSSSTQTSTAPTSAANPTTTTTRASFGNQAITVTTPALSACLAPTAQLALAFDTATVAGSHGTRLTFRSAAFYIDRGVKHTRSVTRQVTVDGRPRTETVRETTYTANATSTRADTSRDLSLRGLTRGTHTVRVIITYNERVTVLIRRAGTTRRTTKTEAVATTITSRISVC